MAGPSWLAGMFAAVMIAVAAYSVSRLGASRLRGRPTELDADGLHAVMGVAMAGMLVPRLDVLPSSVWAAMFGIGAVWFGWHAILPPGLRAADGSRCRFPVPHLIECAAMLYMLLPVGGGRAGGTAAGTAMPGMAAPAGLAGSFPAVPVVLALFMIGYIVWTTDRLTALARAGRTAGAGPGPGRDHQPLLAPRLAACGKIAMSITMGYMLLLML
jgi:hypothetical protein